jgi:hypothetical protein
MNKGKNLTAAIEKKIKGGGPSRRNSINIEEDPSLWVSGTYTIIRPKACWISPLSK